MIHPCDGQTDGRAMRYSIYAVARKSELTSYRALCHGQSADVRGADSGHIGCRHLPADISMFIQFYVHGNCKPFLYTCTRWPKIVSCKLLSIHSPNIDRFSFFFTGIFCGKFVKKMVTTTTYHHTLTALLHHLVKYKSVKSTNIW